MANYVSLDSNKCRTIIYFRNKQTATFFKPRVGPLPSSPGMSVTSQFSSKDFNTDNYQFITYTNGFYPVVKQKINLL